MLYHNHAVLQKEIATNLVNIAGKFIQLYETKKIIDIGCGSGFLAEQLLILGVKRSNILQLDKNPQMIEFAQKFGRAKVWDFDTDTNTDEHFDIALSSMALQWSNDINRVINNVKNTLNNGGKFIFAIPILGSLKELYDIFGKEFMIFRHRNDINATLIHQTEHIQNSYQALRNIHKLGLKTKNTHQITKNTLNTLKKQDTRWNIGYFVS